MQNEKQIFPEFHLFPRLERVARAVGGLFCLHQLSSVSDHKFDHPFDSELYDKPPYSQDALFGADLSGWGTVEE